MRYDNYYLITTKNEKVLVVAKTGREAVDTWVKEKDKEREEDGRIVKFKADNFTVEKICSEVEALKTSE